jgi:hypothetical protein
VKIAPNTGVEELNALMPPHDFFPRFSLDGFFVVHVDSFFQVPPFLPLTRSPKEELGLTAQSGGCLQGRSAPASRTSGFESNEAKQENYQGGVV